MFALNASETSKRLSGALILEAPLGKTQKTELKSSLQPNKERLFLLIIIFFYLHNATRNKKSINSFFFSSLWLAAQLDPIRSSNLTPICIEADVMSENSILLYPHWYCCPFFPFATFVKLNQTKLLRFFFFLFFLALLTPPPPLPSPLSCASLCSLVAGLIYNT